MGGKPKEFFRENICHQPSYYLHKHGNWLPQISVLSLCTELCKYTQVEMCEDICSQDC
ncbi:hypothetical protein LEMLEM_LOCUS16163 [Lemmus lemmus]